MHHSIRPNSSVSLLLPRLGLYNQLFLNWAKKKIILFSMNILDGFRSKWQLGLQTSVALSVVKLQHMSYITFCCGEKGKGNDDPDKDLLHRPFG